MEHATQVEQIKLMVDRTRQLFKRALFDRGLLPTSERPPEADIHPLLTMEMLCDCTHVAEIAVSAYQNQKRVPWNVETYVARMGPRPTGKNEAFEAMMREEFPPGPELGGTDDTPTVIDEACTVVDKDGKILLWHLPNVVSQSAEREWKKSREILTEALKRDGRGSTWRDDTGLFKEGIEGRGGILNWSPAWFQAVRQKPEYKPEVSSSLKGENSLSFEWVCKNTRMLAMPAMVLAIAHPEQYETGIKALEMFCRDPALLREPEHFRRVTKYWWSPFSGVSVIANRRSPAHRDNNSRANWYDILMTIGSYPRIDISFPGLATRFSYNNGTIVALCGQVLVHEVGHIQWGDRVCFAWFMRENIRESLNLERGDFSNVATVASSL